MIVEKIEVQYGLTLNLGNYESLRLTEGATVVIQDVDTPSEVYDKTLSYLEEKVKKDAAAVVKRMKGK